MGDVADRGDEGGIGHGGAGTENGAADRPHRERVPGGDDEQAGGLRQLAAGDQPLAADAV